MALAIPELVLRSLDSSWDYARWEQLPDDGNRYEIISGVLYMTTAPSFFTLTSRFADTPWHTSSGLRQRRQLQHPE